MEIKKNFEMSERYILGMTLAFVGGFLDSYTFVSRGQVFANAQTGNMVLLGMELSNKNYIQAGSYLAPILAFVLGVLISEFVRTNHPNRMLHWRQSIVLFEIIMLFVVAFIPIGHYNIVANVIVSFVCSLQVETFRKMHGRNYATTMCTGNLRSGSELLYHFFIAKDRFSIEMSLKYFGIIIIFILGGITGFELTNIYLEKTIFLACFGLSVVFFLMFYKIKEQ